MNASTNYTHRLQQQGTSRGKSSIRLLGVTWRADAAIDDQLHFVKFGTWEPLSHMASSTRRFNEEDVHISQISRYIMFCAASRSRVSQTVRVLARKQDVEAYLVSVGLPAAYWSTFAIAYCCCACQV